MAEICGLETQLGLQKKFLIFGTKEEGREQLAKCSQDLFGRDRFFMLNFDVSFFMWKFVLPQQDLSGNLALVLYYILYSMYSECIYLFKGADAGAGERGPEARGVPHHRRHLHGQLPGTETHNLVEPA